MSKTTVAVGGSVESYPNKAWSRIPQDVKLEELWQLVGPQVDKHLRNLPLWKVFCVVYYEGLAHGVGGLNALQAKSADASDAKQGGV